MSQLIYGLCSAVAACCAWLLFRAFQGSGARLLLWSSVCFGLLALNSIVLVLDVLVFPSVNLFVVRNVTTLLAIGAMLYGLVWDAR